MDKREIGRGGTRVNPIGLGCMGISAFYGPPMPDAEATKLLHEAIALGVDHFDTAELYMDNEEQLGRALKGKRDQIFLATKFGPLVDWSTGRRLGVDGSEANARRAVEQSLRRLGTDHIDLYYLHRPDASRPIEETVGALKKLVEEGKIRAIGLSEASAENIRRGHAVHPIAAVQTEYSIFTRDVETKVLPALQELGITLVAYSPLGRGMLTGALRAGGDLAQGDFRASNPRFAGDAWAANLALVQAIESVAKARNATSAQVALAWVLASAPNAVVIPGTTKLANLKDNLGAAKVSLSAEDMASLNALAAQVKGQRYDEQGMAILGTSV
ncbi:MAG: aldo/keto reductase [Alphaproteobacteria bacterium]|nr:aldo/keto reductase [Alphaproteobacteria bacterium]